MKRSNTDWSEPVCKTCWQAASKTCRAWSARCWRIRAGMEHGRPGGPARARHCRKTKAKWTTHHQRVVAQGLHAPVRGPQILLEVKVIDFNRPAPGITSQYSLRIERQVGA